MPCVMSENFPTRVPASKHNCTKPLNVRRLGWEFYFSSAVGKKNLIPAYDLTWVTGNYCTTVRDLDDKRSDFKGGSESAKCGKIWLKQTSILHKTYAENRTMDSGKNVDKNVCWFPRSAWERDELCVKNYLFCYLAGFASVALASAPAALAGAFCSEFLVVFFGPIT